MTLTVISDQHCFGGRQLICSHEAATTGCMMRFGIFLPRQAEPGPVPALYWLSGLTCTEENFIVKAGAQRVAAELGMALITPDTSPRGLNLPGDTASYDFGVGAGFYLDATVMPWKTGYQMESYITRELAPLIADNFAIDIGRIGISGHSMGGHGALTLALKNPDYFRSVSAFAPICSTMQCPWGEKALRGYLGDDKAAWANYDATALIASRGWKGPTLLVDQGLRDPFRIEQLKPELLVAACERAQVPLRLREQPAYDHSYFFIATFIEDHLRFHAENLK